MLDLLDQIYSNNNNVILLGDLNHDYDSSGHLVLNPLNQFETLFSMKQLVDVPTRVTLNTSSLLDVISSSDHESLNFLLRIYSPVIVYIIQVGILVYSKPNGKSLKTFLLRAVIFMLHYTVVN